nr:reverse transcriptase domain-containing protein [Tanacetum cinerariifolium]
MKQKGVSNDALRLSIFPYSLAHHAIAWYDRLPRNSIHSFDDMMRKFLSKYFPPSTVTKLRNEITKFEQKPQESLFEAWEHYKLSIDRCSFPCNTVPNPQADLKAITTRSGVTLAGPSVSPPPSSKEVDREPEIITDQVLTESTNNVPPLVVQPSPVSTSFLTISSSKIPEVTKDMVQSSTENIQPLMAQTQVPINEPVVAPKLKLTIPYPLRVNKQKLREKDDILALNFVEIFRNLHFELSFADALLHMPKFALMFKSLLNNKEKLFDLAMTLVNENCSAVILKKLPEKLGDPTIVDYVVDPRILLILGRSFLRTERALIDVYGKELTLHIDDEAITFKVDQTSKYSYNDAELINRVDVIDVACEEYVQEVIGFFDKSKSGNPTPISDPIIALSSPSLTSFEGEELLNNDPSLSLLPPNELNVEEIKTVKSSIDEPPELELKELLSNLEYTFLEGTDKLPIIISKELKDKEKSALLKVLKSHERAIAWKISDIKGIDPRFCTHKVLTEDDFKPMVQHQRRWVSPVYCVPKKGGMTVVENKDNELIPIRLVTGWRVCIEYRKLNDATWKNHFPIPFMDQMLKCLARNEFYCFLDGFSGYFQILIDPQDQEKTSFTCPYGTFAYRRMPFSLCNAPGMFQRCMMAMFYDMIEKTMEVFMDDFLVFTDSFSSCLSHLDKMLQRCEDTNLVLNWEKCHFMVTEGIVLGHEISKFEIEVDRAKVNVIAKLPHSTFVKGVRSFLVLSKTIVYTDHSAFKYLLAKQDAKPRLFWQILLLQEFDVIVRDKKGAENLVADHLSRLENPHQDELEKKKITKTFPLETLCMIAFRGDSCTLWIAPDLEASRARGFVHRLLELQSLTYKNPIS